MAGDFTSAFGNVDVTPVVDGVEQTPVRGILRQAREMDLMDEVGPAIEGVTHRLSIAAEAAAGLKTGRDSVLIVGTSYDIRARSDDGRAMARLYLKGDI